MYSSSEFKSTFDNVAGHDLQSYIKSEMTERVVVVISADLAHTHLSSGPYGYSNASEPFDLVRNGSVTILPWLTVLYYAMKIIIFKNLYG